VKERLDTINSGKKSWRYLPEVAHCYIGRASGSRLMLRELLKGESGEELTKEWSAMAEEEKAEYRMEIEHLREEKHKIVRANPRATMTDVNNTFRAMESDVSMVSLKRLRG
jgi:hypothetical protein